MRGLMNRTVSLFVVAALAAPLGGCFLFGGDDDQKPAETTAAMDASGANSADAVQSTPPSPWRSIDLREEGGGSSFGGILPIVAIVLSVLSLGGVVVHWVFHRRRPTPPV